jgi:hypothetical protein
MARSLLRQLEQIRRAATYDDAVVGANTSPVAEPTVSGSLEEDTNILRTLLKQVKGGTTWYDDPGNYFDPTNTTSGSTDTKAMTLESIKGHTLDAKTIIIAVANDNSAVGWTVSESDTGVLLTSITTRYATPDDRTGLPIYESTANTGTYFDEGGMDNVCRVDIVNLDTDGEVVDGGGDVIYGKLYDGEDFTGTGDGIDVYVRFYADDVETTMVSGVSSLAFVYPQRKTLTNMEEYEWLRTDFISSWEGDVELIEDIQNLWSYTGSSDNVTDPSWDNTSANYIIVSDPCDLTTAINLLNTEIGDRTYTESNYVVTGEDVADSLDALDIGLGALADSIEASVAEKYIESVSVLIDKNVEHPLPYSLAFTPFSTAGQEGKNMDVFVDGQLLSADTGADGANADRDYGETTASGVTFRFDVQVGRNVTYMIRQ